VIEQIDTWSDLQARAAELLDRLNAEPALAVAAAASPVLAIEWLGYSIDPQARPGIVERMRLGPDVADELARLRAEVARIADRPVHPDDPDDVRRLLIELKIATDELDTRPPRWRPGGAGPDQLERLADRHPVMKPLLAYRRLSARAPQFAPRHVFEAVLAGRLTPAVTSATGRLQRDSRPD
jgi:hypothetical protein